MIQYLLILLLYPAIVGAQADSIVIKVPFGQSSSLANCASSATTDSMRTNIYNGINGRTATADSMRTNIYNAMNGKLGTAGNGGSLTGLTKTQVGLANVDNTTDAGKPVSSATQTALNLKANL